MQYLEFERKSGDGLTLFVREWIPANQCAGVVCLIHGLGEHSGRYFAVAEALQREGFALLAFDLRGHGNSQGTRGHCPSYEALMADIDVMVAEVRKGFPGKPLFLYGHSLGGNLVLNYCLRRQPHLTGVVVTSPWLRLAFEPSGYLVGLAKVMNKFWPGFLQSNGLDAKDLSHDLEIVLSYGQDSMVHDQISARMYIEVYQAGGWAVENAGKFALPLLLMHGGGDRITSAAASHEFSCGTAANCTFKLWDGLYHELHNELEREKVIGFVRDWLKGRKQEC